MFLLEPPFWYHKQSPVAGLSFNLNAFRSKLLVNNEALLNSRPWPCDLQTLQQALSRALRESCCRAKCCCYGRPMNLPQHLFCLFFSTTSHLVSVGCVSYKIFIVSIQYVKICTTLDILSNVDHACCWYKSYHNIDLCVGQRVTL